MMVKENITVYERTVSLISIHISTQMLINAGVTTGNTKAHIKTNRHTHDSCGNDICNNDAEVIVCVCTD